MLSATTMPNDWAQTCLDALAYLQDQLPWHAQARPSRTDRASASDEDCMASYRRGDTEAFRILYQRYRDKLHRYVLRLSNRPSEAEEVFQDIWISVINGKDRYEPTSSFAAWLFSIAHRRAADRWRALSRHAPDGLSSSAEDDLAQHIPALTHTPERHAHNDALGEALLAAIETLPLPQREAFLMKAEGGLSLEEIALATGVSRETVKSRLRYAQQRLRTALEAWQ